MQRIRQYLPDGFTLILIGTVILASFLPCRGWGAELFDYLTIAAIALLFFQHGAKLSREAILAGMTHWRLHLLILASTFILFPILAYALEFAIPQALPPSLWLGLIFVAVLPSTVQSSIAFTSIAGGNIPAAVCAASISSLLGIFLTPVMASGLMSLNGGGVSLDEIWRVVLQLFVPFAAGHLMRPWIGKWVDRHRQILSTTDRGSILLAVYTAFSAAVVEGIWHKLAVPQMLMIVVVAIILLALVMVIVYGASRKLGFNREDRIAILFCGSKKSLAAGIPMAKVLFAAPLVGVMVLPLMIFHQVQLMVCAFLARRFAAGIPAESPLSAAASSSQGAVGA